MKLQRIIILALGLCAPALFGMQLVEEDLNLVITQLAAQWEFPLESMKAMAGAMVKSFQKKFATTPKTTLMQEQLTKLLAVQKRYKPEHILWVKQQCELKDAQQLFIFIYHTNPKSVLAAQRAEYFKVRASLRNLATQSVPTGTTISTSTLSDVKKRYAQTHPKNNIAEIEQDVIKMKEKLEREFKRPVEDRHLVGIIEGALSNNVSLDEHTEKVIERYRELKPPPPPSQSNIAPPLKPAGNSADAPAPVQRVSENPPAVNTAQTATTPANKGEVQSTPQPESKADGRAQATTDQLQNSATDPGTTKTGSGFEKFITYLNTHKRVYFIVSSAVAVSALAAAGAYWYFGSKKETQKKIIA